jgi:hypothetical protein
LQNLRLRHPDNLQPFGSLYSFGAVVIHDEGGILAPRPILDERGSLGARRNRSWHAVLAASVAARDEVSWTRTLLVLGAAISLDFQCDAMAARGSRVL